MQGLGGLQSAARLSAHQAVRSGQRHLRSTLLSAFTPVQCLSFPKGHESFLKERRKGPIKPFPFCWPPCVLGPWAPPVTAGLARAWNIPGLPLTPQDRHRPLKELGAHHPEPSLHLLGLRLSSKPPSLTGVYAPLRHLSLSARGAITFHPVGNKQTLASRAR